MIGTFQLFQHFYYSYREFNSSTKHIGKGQSSLTISKRLNIYLIVSGSLLSVVL